MSNRPFVLVDPPNEKVVPFTRPGSGTYRVVGVKRSRINRINTNMDRTYRVVGVKRSKINRINTNMDRTYRVVGVKRSKERIRNVINNVITVMMNVTMMRI